MIALHSLWHLSDNQSVIQKVDKGVPPIDHCEIQSSYSLISSGTERLIARGQVPASLYKEMKVPYMEGTFQFPLTYGYSLVGKVVDKDHPLQGKLVHAMHPHQDFCQIKEKDLFVIPSEITAKRATLASNLETALTAIWDAEVSVGDRVLIVGFGLIGSLVARILSLVPAVTIFVKEVDETRQKLAESLGFQIVKETTRHAGFDIAFHASATSEGLQKCIDAVGFEGKIIELSWYGSKSVEVNLGSSFHNQRKRIISSQVGNLPSSHQARWDFKRRKEVVFELLKNEIFDQHITHLVKFVDTPAFFADLRAGNAKGLAYCIEY